MSYRKIDMYEYRAIIYRLREGMSARKIADIGLAGRRKVNAINQLAVQNGWLAKDVILPDDACIAEQLPSQYTAPRQSKAEPYREFITQAVEEGVCATVIHQRLVDNYDFKGAYNSVQRFVQQIKASDLSEMTVPLHFAIGEAAQVDFGKGPCLYDERIQKEIDTWFFVMTLCWSRHQYAELVTHQDIETWLRCHQNAFCWFGGVAGKIIVDNAKCAIVKACYHDPTVQRSYEGFAQDYGFIISACPPYDPQKKGRVESGVKFIKSNFLPLRQLKSLQHANEELKKWVTTVAGLREHGSTFKKPIEEFNATEKASLKPLPERLPEIAVWQKVSLYRDCHVRYHYCHYSAPFDLYKKPLWLKATPTTVSIYHEHTCVAHHARLFKKGEKSTKKAHLPPNARYYLTRNREWCLNHSGTIGENCSLIIKTLIEHPTQDLLRQAQGILSLADIYEKTALEKACQRALAFQVANYRTIKDILEKGLETEPLTADEPIENTRAIYQGDAHFQRSSDEFNQHQKEKEVC